jgi:hypothetical protein
MLISIFLQILIMRVAGGTQSPALVSAADLTPLAEPLLHGLFGAFEMASSAENEYVMKCVMRSFSTLQEWTDCVNRNISTTKNVFISWDISPILRRENLFKYNYYLRNVDNFDP